MTPLRAKYIRDLVIRGRSKNTQEAYTRCVCDLARYYHRSPELIGLAAPSHQGAPTGSLQRQHRRERRALSLRRDTWPREGRLDGFGPAHEARHRARGSLRAQAGFGGLVLCVDIEEANLWRSYLKAAGRLKDGLFFSIDSPLRFNVLDYEAAKSGVDFVENLVTLLCDAASVQRRSEATGSEAHFWLSQKQKLMRNAITLLSLAGAPVQLKNLYKVLIESATSQLQADSEKWQTTSYVYDLLCRAEANSGKHSEFEPVKDYWLRERPALDPRTRSNIDADFTGMFDPLTRGKIGELFGTTTNITPEDIFNGKIIVIDIPVKKWREVGQHAAVIWAQLFQRAVDNRLYVPRFTRPVFLWEDEAPHFPVGQE